MTQTQLVRAYKNLQKDQNQNLSFYYASFWTERDLKKMIFNQKIRGLDSNHHFMNYNRVIYTLREQHLAQSFTNDPCVLAIVGKKHVSRLVSLC